MLLAGVDFDAHTDAAFDYLGRLAHEDQEGLVLGRGLLAGFLQAVASFWARLAAGRAAGTVGATGWTCRTKTQKGKAQAVHNGLLSLGRCTRKDETPIFLGEDRRRNGGGRLGRRRRRKDKRCGWLTRKRSGPRQQRNRGGSQYRPDQQHRGDQRSE